MIDIGDKMAGAGLFIDETAATPHVRSVHIRNLGRLYRPLFRR